MLTRTSEQLADIAHREQFHWHPQSRVFLHDNLLDFGIDPVGDGPVEMSLRHLHKAVHGGLGLRVSEAGIEVLPHALQPNFQCMTSGTTGPAKVVERSPASWIASFSHNARLFGLGPESHFAVLGQLSHSLSLYGVMEALHLGADIHILAGQRPDRQLAQLAKHQISLIYATPTQLGSMIDIAGERAVLSDVRHVLCGGGALLASSKVRLKALFPKADIIEFYGASETSFVTMADAMTPDGSVGKAYGGAHIDIRDTDGLITKGVGQVWVKSPFLFDSYAVGKSDHTRWSKDGFLTVGELGVLDHHGYLFLKGRADRMVTIADQNVHPEEIETLIQNDLRVTRCCVLAVPDVKRGHSLVAIIEGPQNLSLAEDLITMLRRKLGPLKTPRRILFHPNIPLRTAGKADLPCLRSWLETQT